MSIFNDVKKKIEREVMRPARDTLNGLRREIEGNLKGIQREIEGAARSAEGSLKSIQREVEGAARLAEHQIDKLATKAFEDIKVAAEDALDDVREELVSAATAQALNIAIAVIQTVAPSTFRLKLGPIAIHLNDAAGRIDTLKYYADHAPGTGADIKAMVIALAPTRISVGGDISLAFLIVQSDSLSVGWEAGWATEDVIDRLEDVLAHFGID